MANTSSAKKAIRNQKRKTIRNKRIKTAFRDARKEVLKAAAAGDEKAVAEKMQVFQKAVDKAAKNGGPLHANTAARMKSRLANQVAA